MIVETKIAGSKDTESRDVPVPSETVSLRELLSALVRHELSSYERRRAASRLLRVLTPADLVRGVETGVYGRENRVVSPPPVEAVAVDRAVEAFTDGLFFVFIDGIQIEELDAPLAIRPDSTLRMVRLVALTGG